MPVVSDVVLRYAARGAQAAAAADRMVRDQVQQTARIAKRDSLVTREWLRQHRLAIASIGAGLTGLFAVIISNSPAVSAHLGGIRLALSLLAMEVGDRLAPIFQWLEERAFELADAFAALPGPVKDAIAAATALGATFGTIAIAWAVLEKVFKGTTLLGFLRGLIGSIVGLLTETLVGGILGVVSALGVAALAWRQNWFGMRDTLDKELGLAGGIISSFLDTLNAIFDVTMRAVQGDWAGAWRRIEDLARDSTFRILLGILDTSRFLRNAFQGLANAPQPFINALLEMGPVVTRVVQEVMQRFNSLVLFDLGGIGRTLLLSLANGMFAALSFVSNPIQAVIAVVSELGRLAQRAFEWGRNLISSFISGIQSSLGALGGILGSVVSLVTGAIGSAGTKPAPAVPQGAHVAVRNFSSGRAGTFELAGDIARQLGNRPESFLPVDIPRAFFEALYRAAGGKELSFDTFDSIRRALNFDVPYNDQMARKWGRDFAQHFSDGMSLGAGARQPNSGPTIIIESGAFQISGERAERLRVSELAEEVVRIIESRARGRSVLVR